jgi:hypothetical protein
MPSDIRSFFGGKPSQSDDVKPAKKEVSTSIQTGLLGILFSNSPLFMTRIANMAP